MASGSSAQAADVDTFLAAGPAQARAQSDTLPEEVCSLHQAESAAAQRIQGLEHHLRQEAKGVEQVLGSAGGGTSSSAEPATEARKEWTEVIVRIKALWESQKLKHILEIQEQRFGKEDRDTLNTKIDLAAALQLQKDFTGAQKQLEEVFEALSRARSANLKPNLEEASEALGQAGPTDLKDDPITRRAVDCFASLLGCLHEDKDPDLICNNDILRVARFGSLGAVQHLLRTRPGAVAETDLDGATGLHLAAIDGCADLCRVLLAAGAQVDARERLRGDTPLHYAAESGHVEVVKLLVEAKASVTVKDFQGRTPLDLARSNRHHEVVTILENVA